MNLLLATFLVQVAVAGPPVPPPDTVLVVRGARVIPVAGAPIERGAVLVRNGRIEAVGASIEAPAGARVIERADAVIFPGFVDGACWLGARRQRDETTSAILPDLRVAETVDAADPSFADARRAGITTFHLVPGDANVVGGRSAVAKAGPDGRLRFLAREAGLKLSLAESAFTPNREPTSLLGAAEILRREAEQPATRAFVNRGAKLFITAWDRRACDLAADVGVWFGVRPVLFSGPAVADRGLTVVENSAGVILGPILPDHSDRDRASAARLASAGATIGFASGAPLNPPEALRLGAAVCRSAGLRREAAWAALTLGCAQLLGVADRVGSIETGKDADLVVLTHEPTDLRARVLIVIQDGAVVHDATTGKE